MDDAGTAPTPPAPRRGVRVGVAALAALTTVVLGFSLGPRSVGRGEPVIPMEKAFAACGESDRDACVARAVVERAHVLGPRRAVDDLAALLRTNSDARETCHPLSHAVGSAMFAEFEWDAVFGDADWCNWGYYHGLLTGAASGLEGLQELGMQLCSEVAASGMAEFECLHGIGHAAYQSSGNLRESFTACDGLQGQDAYVCANGVVMEAFTQRSTEHFEEQDFGAEDCLELSPIPMIGGCAQGLAAVMFELGYDLGESCRMFTSTDAGDACFMGYGMRVVSKALEGPDYSHSNVESCMQNTECAYWVGETAYQNTFDLFKAEALCALLADDVGTSSCRRGVTYARGIGSASDPSADVDSGLGR